MEGQSSDQSEASRVTNHNQVGAVLRISVAGNNKAPIPHFLSDSENWRDFPALKLSRLW